MFNKLHPAQIQFMPDFLSLQYTSKVDPQKTRMHTTFVIFHWNCWISTSKAIPCQAKCRFGGSRSNREPHLLCHSLSKCTTTRSLTVDGRRALLSRRSWGPAGKTWRSRRCCKNSPRTWNYCSRPPADEPVRFGLDFVFACTSGGKKFQPSC